MKELTDAKTQRRKDDARLKIELGGLVIKAGLKGAERAFVLGALVEAARLAPGSTEHARLVQIGKDNLRK